MEERINESINEEEKQSRYLKKIVNYVKNNKKVITMTLLGLGLMYVGYNLINSNIVSKKEIYNGIINDNYVKIIEMDKNSNLSEKVIIKGKGKSLEMLVDKNGYVVEVHGKDDGAKINIKKPYDKILEKKLRDAYQKRYEQTIETIYKRARNPTVYFKKNKLKK